MTRVLIEHHVDDVEAWRAVFEDAAGIRYAAGERDYEVMQSVDDPRLVVHLSTWPSVAAATSFFESPQLVRIRAAAGVHEPRFTYLDRVCVGELSS